MTAFLLLGVFSVCVAIGTPIGTSNVFWQCICTPFQPSGHGLRHGAL